MADPMAAPLSTRLTGPEVPLLHALCFCAVSMAFDDRLDLVVDAMRAALKQCPPRPATAKLRMAAESICQSYARRNQPAGSADWTLAAMQAGAAAQQHHWTAFCASAGV